MRTPNVSCVLCDKPLYRRPNELARVRYVACMGCRARAQRVGGITERQEAGLGLGRQKGTNHRLGYRHKPESRLKASVSNKVFCATNPEKVAARGAKIRGRNHYRWRGGLSNLCQSVRQMTETRKWIADVKARDGRCVRCGSVDNLEAHHLRSFSEIVASLGILTRDDARLHAPVLWDVGNGETLCAECHYAEHGRSGRTTGQRPTILKTCVECQAVFAVRPSEAHERVCCGRVCSGRRRAKFAVRENNANWRGGSVEKTCPRCGGRYAIKPAVERRGQGRFCSWGCYADSRRNMGQDARASSGAL
jgi:hypothetical protein